MMHLSDSKIQMNSEKLILEGLETKLDMPKGSLQTKRIKIDNAKTVEIDGYNDEHKIMVEVFAKIGRLLAANYGKLANDILKLKLVEDILKVPHKKYLAVCGVEAENYLLGSSWKAFAVKYYDFEVVRIDLTPDQMQMILEAQKRQKYGMKL